MQLDVQNPKPKSDGDTRWYPYYAGYSEAFLRDVLLSMALEPGSIVMDPWNGSGTTTAVSRRMGYGASGFDINPALVIVAKARVLDKTVVPSLRAIAEEIALSASAVVCTADRHDSLAQWFSPGSTSYLRALEKSTNKLLVDHSSYATLYSRRSLSDISSLAAFFYVALFQLVRMQLTSFRSSNPTWIKTAKSEADKVEVSRNKLRSAFIKHVKELAARVAKTEVLAMDETATTLHLDVADSLNLPVRSRSVDAIVTSPPYCTRIDYVVSTLPELAVLGSPTKRELKTFRDRMIGTPTIIRGDDDSNELLGKTAIAFLEKVRTHGSKASNTYYSRHLRQYFTALNKSLIDLDRSLKPGGLATFVVQDSYYKNIHNDLPTILSEQANAMGWRLLARRDFEIGNPLRAIHIGSKTNRRPIHATESVLVLKK